MFLCERLYVCVGMDGSIESIFGAVEFNGLRWTWWTWRITGWL